MAKAIVVHGVPTDWRIGGLASCLEEITGKVIGVRWLLGVERWGGHDSLFSGCLPRQGSLPGGRKQKLRWRGKGSQWSRTGGEHSPKSIRGGGCFMF